MSQSEDTMTSVVQQYVDLCDDIKAKEAEVDALKERKKAISERLVSDFANEQVEKMTVRDGKDKLRTVYVHKQAWAKLGEGFTPEDGLAALRKAKLGSLIKEQWNASTLSSYFREVEESGRKLPASLTKVFTFSPTFDIRVVAGGKG